MKRMLGSILGLAITLPAIANAQAVNTYHPQQMRMAAPVMPYHMNRVPYPGRWNPWMMPARAPMRPMMHRPYPGRYGQYPVAHYQPRANIPRYPAPTQANTHWRNYRAGAVAPYRMDRRFAGVPAYGYRTHNSYPGPQMGAYHRARPTHANTHWRNYRAGTVAPYRMDRRSAGLPAYGYRAHNSYPVPQMGAYHRARPIHANTHWRNYRAGTVAPYRMDRRFAGVPAYGHRAHNSFPAPHMGAYRTARRAFPVQQRGWQQASRPGNINQHRNWRNAPVRFAPTNQYAAGKYAPVRGNPYAYPSRANRSPQVITQNRFANNRQHPAWRHYKQAQQRFIPGRYVIPAANPAMKNRTTGNRGTNTPIAWGANPYARNPAANVQARSPKSYRMAYDYYRR